MIVETPYYDVSTFLIFNKKYVYLKNFSYLCTFELIHNFSNGKDYRDSKSEGRCR